MASFRAFLIAEIRNNYAIRTTMTKVNRLLWESVEADRFVTALFGVLDTEQRRFTYVNAGHNPAFLLRAATGQFETLDATGPLLGTFDAATYKERVVELKPDDVLLLYTDGVTEAMTATGELFGDDRLKDVMRALRGQDASSIVRGIWETTQAFRDGEQDDDVTIVAIKAKGD
jgi:sigma-B regulation protein RsbU (phosphoserine phosphatase)